MHHRVVKIESLAWMNRRGLLGGVQFIHLKRGNGCLLVLGQIERLTRRDRMRPVARSNIVIRTSGEPAGRREESIHCANPDALLVPTNDERLIVRICKAAASTNWASNVRS